MNKEVKWEPIIEWHTFRLKVPGGWLYRVNNYDGTALALSFVPEPIDKTKDEA